MPVRAGLEAATAMAREATSTAHYAAMATLDEKIARVNVFRKDPLGVDRSFSRFVCFFVFLFLFFLYI